MGHVLPFQQYARSFSEQTLARADFSKPLWVLLAPRKIRPYSIKGMLRGQKIEVSEKIFKLNFI
jgi:hypothetical protein